MSTSILLIDTSPENDSVSVNKVFRALLPQSEKWFKVGVDLGLDTQTLSQISAKHKNKDISLMEVVRHWFVNNPNPSWTSLTSKINISELILLL